jgi:hypothetical protein
MSDYISSYEMQIVSNPETTFNPLALSTAYYLPPTNKDAEHEGCYVCRWRKKKCQFQPGVVPGPSTPCVDCQRFHIRCHGAGLERPGVSAFSQVSSRLSHSDNSSQGKTLADKIRLELKTWIQNKANRKLRDPLDIRPLYAGVQQDREFVPFDPATGTATRMIHQNQQPAIHEHELDFGQTMGLVQPLFPLNPNYAGCSNPSDSHYHQTPSYPSHYNSNSGYAEHGGIIDHHTFTAAITGAPSEPFAADPSPVWGDVNHRKLIVI